jgi:deoxyadenosine/deoxycytidine kinase
MIIGIEGHSYTGKTTIVDAMKGVAGVTVIPETDVYAGGIDNYPPFPPTTDQMAITNVEFFAELERRRRTDVDRATGAQILDRTFVSVPLFQKFIRQLENGWADSFSYAKDAYHAQIDRDEVALPDAMVVLSCANTAEYLSRTSRDISVDELRTVEAYQFFTESYRHAFEPYHRLGRLAEVVNRNGDDSSRLCREILTDLALPPLAVDKKKKLAHEVLERL